MNALQAHIKAHNAIIESLVDEDPANRFAILLPTDPEYWAAKGITTVEEFERFQLINSINVTHRDAYGVLPEYDFDKMTTAELEECAEHLSTILQLQEDDELPEGLFQISLN